MCFLHFQGFFQRNSTRKSWPVCQVPSQCAAAKNKKMMCATCRYQKCISLGMSKRGNTTRFCESTSFSYFKVSHYSTLFEEIEILQENSYG